MSFETIEQASTFIRTYGTPRQREMRAYYHAYGRFADLITLAAKIRTDRTAAAVRHLTIVAA